MRWKRSCVPQREAQGALLQALSALLTPKGTLWTWSPRAAQGWGSLYLVLAVASSKALAMYPVYSLKCGTWPQGELRTCRHVSGPALPSPPRTEPAGQLALSLLHLEATKEASD